MHTCIDAVSVSSGVSCPLATFPGQICCPNLTFIPQMPSNMTVWVFQLYCSASFWSPIELCFDETRIPGRRCCVTLDDRYPPLPSAKGLVSREGDGGRLARPRDVVREGPKEGLDFYWRIGRLGARRRRYWLATRTKRSPAADAKTQGLHLWTPGTQSWPKAKCRTYAAPARGGLRVCRTTMRSDEGREERGQPEAKGRDTAGKFTTMPSGSLWPKTWGDGSDLMAPAVPTFCCPPVSTFGRRAWAPEAPTRRR